MVFNRTSLIYTNFITSKNMKQPQPCDHFLLYSPWSARETFNVVIEHVPRKMKEITRNMIPNLIMGFPEFISEKLALQSLSIPSLSPPAVSCAIYRS